MGAPTIRDAETSLIRPIDQLERVGGLSSFHKMHRLGKIDASNAKRFHSIGAKAESDAPVPMKTPGNSIVRGPLLGMPCRMQTVAFQLQRSRRNVPLGLGNAFAFRIGASGKQAPR